ncbi:MAG: ribonuclease HII [bacterium]|nr:ribonuclease HII [bacterium]
MDWVIGIDEVGRGALAGPMYVGGAVIGSSHSYFKELTNIKSAGFELWLNKEEKIVLRDSKKLSSRQRKKVYEKLRPMVDGQMISLSNVLIDKVGISRAFWQAVNKILKLYGTRIDLEKTCLLIDGQVEPRIKVPVKKVVMMKKGDDRVGIIAAASVLAKVARDDLMHKLDSRYPVYGWKTNVGYGTKEHIRAIKQHGLCRYHRRSFCRRICGT